MTQGTWILGALNTRHTHKSLGTACLQAWWQRVPGRRALERLDLDMNRSVEDHYAEILDLNPAVLAMGCHIWNVEMTLRLTGALKAVNPDLIVILGGPEVSFDAPTTMAAHPWVDFIVTGEGERPLEALLSRLDEGSARDGSDIAGLTWRNSQGEIVQNPGEWVIERFDDLPSPFTTGLYGRGEGFTYYEASRGCPFSCEYCLSSVEQGVRELSIERVFADLDWLMSAEFSQVRFADRTFNLKPERAIAIIEHILAHNVRRIGFHFELAADLLTDALIERLALAPPGLFHLEIGVQSMDAAVVADVRRKSDLPLLARRVRELIERTRCHVHLDLLLGLPADDRPTFLRSLDETFALAPHTLQVGTVKLLKGTALRDRAPLDGIAVQPFPPYQALATRRMSAAEMARFRDAGRLIETLYNCRRFNASLRLLSRWAFAGSPAAMYEWLAAEWRSRGLPFHGTNPEGWARLLVQVVPAAPCRDARRLAAVLDVVQHEQRLATKVPAGPLGPAPIPATPDVARSSGYRLASGVRVFWASTDLVPLLVSDAAEPDGTSTPMVYRFETDLSRPPETRWLDVPVVDRWVIGLLALGVAPGAMPDVLAGRLDAPAVVGALANLTTREMIAPFDSHKRPRRHSHPGSFGD